MLKIKRDEFGLRHFACAKYAGTLSRLPKLTDKDSKEGAEKASKSSQTQLDRV